MARAWYQRCRPPRSRRRIGFEEATGRDRLLPLGVNQIPVARVDRVEPAEAAHVVARLAGDVAPDRHVVHRARGIRRPDHDRAGLDEGTIALLAPRATEVGAPRGRDVLDEDRETTFGGGDAAHVQPEAASRIVLVVLDWLPLAGGAAQGLLQSAVGEEGELVPHDAAEECIGVAAEPLQEGTSGGVGEDEAPLGIEDEHGVAHTVHRLLELGARLFPLGGELGELLVRLLQLLGHRVALLELDLELHRLILELGAGE